MNEKKKTFYPGKGITSELKKKIEIRVKNLGKKNNEKNSQHQKKVRNEIRTKNKRENNGKIGLDRIGL